jgi:tetratricopeptide (TPR) repeat protein
VRKPIVSKNTMSVIIILLLLLLWLRMQPVLSQYLSDTEELIISFAVIIGALIFAVKQAGYYFGFNEKCYMTEGKNGRSVDDKGHAVLVIDMFHYDPEEDIVVGGFQTLELAREYARRRTRDSLEAHRGKAKDREELRKMWYMSGEDCIVLDDSYKGSSELDYFLDNPASEEERNWSRIDKGETRAEDHMVKRPSGDHAKGFEEAAALADDKRDSADLLKKAAQAYEDWGDRENAVRCYLHAAQILEKKEKAECFLACFRLYVEGIAVQQWECGFEWKGVTDGSHDDDHNLHQGIIKEYMCEAEKVLREAMSVEGAGRKKIMKRARAECRRMKKDGWGASECREVIERVTGN